MTIPPPPQSWDLLSKEDFIDRLKLLEDELVVQKKWLAEAKGEFYVTGARRDPAEFARRQVKVMDLERDIRHIRLELHRFKKTRSVAYRFMSIARHKLSPELFAEIYEEAKQNE